MSGRIGGLAGALGRRALWRQVLRATGGFVVEGPVPREPCVVVANHASHADTAALLAALPARRRPLVAAAADYWFAGRTRAALCRGLAAGFPVRRGRGFEDLAAAAGWLAAGHTVVVFPEGTRSRDGAVGRFHSGATRLAELADVPLVPAGLLGTGRLLPVHGRLRRAPVTVRFGEPTRDPCEAYLAVCRLAEREDREDREEHENERAGTHDNDRHDRHDRDDGHIGVEGLAPDQVGGDAGFDDHRGAHQQGHTPRLPARLRQRHDA